ncbi:hypothetical protein CLOP_g18160, partial [Closterium sp. NIES-67]
LRGSCCQPVFAFIQCGVSEATRVTTAPCVENAAEPGHPPTRGRESRSRRSGRCTAPAAEPAQGVKREEEKFAVVNTGKWECKSCGYVYDQFKGDPAYPVAPGVSLKELPEDWLCPTCGAAPTSFGSLSRELAGFAQNQAYGLGGNSLTSAQKGLLIWGSIGAAVFGFLSGYFLE